MQKSERQKILGHSEDQIGTPERLPGHNLETSPRAKSKLRSGTLLWDRNSILGHIFGTVPAALALALALAMALARAKMAK